MCDGAITGMEGLEYGENTGTIGPKDGINIKVEIPKLECTQQRLQMTPKGNHYPQMSVGDQEEVPHAKLS